LVETAIQRMNEASSPQQPLDRLTHRMERLRRKMAQGGPKLEA